jgi:hypothetical protein
MAVNVQLKRFSRQDIFFKEKKGQASVVFRTADDALAAKRQLHRTMVQGSIITVRF